MIKTAVTLLFTIVLSSADDIVENVCVCHGKKLDCTNRNLRSLAQAVLPALPCPEMKYIEVSRNKLVGLDFPESMTGLSSVVHINASHNRLKSLDGIREWGRGILEVQRNQLKKIDLSTARRMNELRAHDNILEEIVLPTEKCSLIIMSLQHNRFRSLPEGLDRCPPLTYIDASQNLLTNLDISSTSRLEYVKIANNALRTIQLPTEVCKLVHLNATSNYLSNIPDDISKCTKLETIDLSNNSFATLPQALLQLLKLRKIKHQDEDPNFPEILVDLRGNSQLTFSKVSNAFRDLSKTEGRIRVFYNKYESECECAVLKMHEGDFVSVQFCISAMCSRGGYDLWGYV